MILSIFFNFQLLVIDIYKIDITQYFIFIHVIFIILYTISGHCEQYNFTITIISILSHLHAEM